MGGAVLRPTDIPDPATGEPLYVLAKVRPRWYWHLRRLLKERWIAECRRESGEDIDETDFEIRRATLEVHEPGSKP